MVSVTFWSRLLLVILILRQSAAASDQCSGLQEEIYALERDIVRITEQKRNFETEAGECQEQLTKQIHISQKAEALHSNLKKQLEANEEVLKDVTDKQTQMQTAIDGLKETVELINLRSQAMCRTEENVCPSLLEAAKSGDVNTAKVLFKCSRNDTCNDNDQYGSTPLTYAAIYGHLELVRMLLEEGANVERTDGSAYTALHQAVWNGHLDVCRLLLDWGAKVDAVNKAGNTPLIWAVWAGHSSIAKLLVERGADVSLKNVDGDTASDFARREAKAYLAEWLDSVSSRKEP